MFKNYQIVFRAEGAFHPDTFLKKEVLDPSTAWGKIYKWILHVGPVEIRKWG